MLPMHGYEFREKGKIGLGEKDVENILEK